MKNGINQRGLIELLSVKLPDGLTRIEAYTFASNAKMTSIKIPAGVTYIGDYAFRFCNGMKSITVENPDPPTLGLDAFTSGLKDIPVYVPTGRKNVYGTTNVWKIFTDIRELGYLFKVDQIHYLITNSYAKEIRVVPELDTKTYPAYTSGYEPYGNISIPSEVEYNSVKYNVISVAQNSFRNCTNLSMIDIPASVTTLYDDAFNGCTGLKSMVIRNAEQPFLAANVFTNVAKNIPVQVPKGSKTTYEAADQWKDFTNIQEAEYDTHDDTFFFKITSKVSFNRTASVVPELTFGSAPFYTTGKLLSGKIEIPSNIVHVSRTHTVTLVEENAFNRNTEITSVSIPHTIKELGNSAFERCGKLTDLTLYEGLETIGQRTFWDCFYLNSLDLPATVKTIGQFAFSGCTSLKSVTSKSVTPPQADYFSFMNVPKNIPLYVPVGSKKAYENANEWKEFTNIIERSFESATPVVQQNNIIIWSEKGTLHIKMNDANKPGIVEIYNISGQMVKKIVLNSSADIPLHSGVYVVRLENFAKKVVIK